MREPSGSDVPTLDSIRYRQFLADESDLLSGEKKYVDNLIKTTSKFLSSVGPNGIVLFATNLMDQRKRGRNNDGFNR
jgi:hypothetical protein